MEFNKYFPEKRRECLLPDAVPLLGDDDGGSAESWKENFILKIKVSNSNFSMKPLIISTNTILT